MAEEKIYHIKVVESSANQISGIRHINQKQTEITYKLEKEKRDTINRIRARSKINYYARSLNFFDSRYIKGDYNLEIIRRDVERADYELKQISPTLGAHMVVMQLDSEYVRQGEVFERIRSAIKAQVYGDLIERLEKLVLRKTIPENSKKALLRMCDNLENINILNDDEVTDKINLIRDMIRQDLIAPVLEDLTKEAERMQNNFVYVEEEEGAGEPDEIPGESFTYNNIKIEVEEGDILPPAHEHLFFVDLPKGEQKNEQIEVEEGDILPPAPDEIIEV